jgi:hypothetical protein
LLPFLTERLEAAQADLVTMTVAAMNEDPAPKDESTTFVDESGVVHDPVMLTCVLDGQAKQAGVAVLTHHQVPARKPISLLISAVSAHLIRAGDTRGLVVDDTDIDDDVAAQGRSFR